MDRQKLIDRLVNRKLAAGATRAFCVCMAGKASAATGQQAAPKK